jgi:DNA-directed RNA polymerase specialized sigma24 family protein
VHGPDDILTVDDRDQLERAFRRLTVEQRAVLVFHHYLGLSLSEVADRIGIPVGTATDAEQAQEITEIVESIQFE